MIHAMTKSPETLSEVPEAITPKVLFDELRRGVLGQDRALRFVSVAIHKHVLGKVSGNILLIGSSGTGKTTIMNNIQRLYDTVPGFEPFRAVTILNANLLVDSERTEFRPDRMFAAVEQRARVILGEKPSLAQLEESHCRLRAHLLALDAASFDRRVAGSDPTLRGMLLGLLQHNAYHAGQIVLLAKAARSSRAS